MKTEKFYSRKIGIIFFNKTILKMEEIALNYIKTGSEFRFESRMIDKSHSITDVKGEIEDLYEELKDIERRKLYIRKKIIRKFMKYTALCNEFSVRYMVEEFTYSNEDREDTKKKCKILKDVLNEVNIGEEMIDRMCLAVINGSDSEPDLYDDLEKLVEEGRSGG